MVNQTISSLEDIQPGETVRIRTILFDQVREECSRVGVHAGQVVRSSLASEGYLLLELPHGARVALRRELTRFIDTEPPTHAAPPAAADVVTEMRTLSVAG